MLKTARILLLALILCWAAAAPADDGMWLPHQMKTLDLKSLGLRMDPGDLYKTDGTGLMSAVVWFGGGTGEFVSSKGLILTNHHVAFGAIQRAADKDNDYIRNGFLAASLDKEIPAQGYTADVLLGYDDVTAEIQARLKKGMTPRQRYDAIEKATRDIVARAEKAGPDIRANVASMYSGNEYHLFRFKRLRDVRLVYAPPQDIGNYGGDIDNWMWPRHTGDFTFLRAYVAPDGSGAAFSADNVPYQPKVHFKISLDGVKEGDFTFVMGYPGRTYRNFAPSELRTDMESMARRKAEFEDIIRFLEDAAGRDKNVEIRYASKLQGLNNSHKNMTGKLEGMEKYGLLERKAREETAFRDWLNADPKRKAEFGGALENIEAFMERLKAFSGKSEFLNNIVSSFFGSTLLSQAHTIVRAAEQFQKPDKDREPGFQERNAPYIRQGIELAERGYVLETDKAFFKHQLKKLSGLSPEQIPAAFKTLAADPSPEAVEAFVDRLYAGTTLADPKRRLELLSMTPAQLAALKDPMLALAADLEKEISVLREQGKAMSQERSDLKMVYEKALLGMTEGRLATDANSTIRFTHGPVEGYVPRDAVAYLPLTTLGGVVEKETGEFPFIVPEKLKALYESRDFGRYADSLLGDVPVCFLNTASVTGGNSGSPTLNADGEIVGIIFDMTYESVIGDYLVIPELQRSISVDIRYVLFITEKFSGADHIIRELGF